jgi:cysteine synthase
VASCLRDPGVLLQKVRSFLALEIYQNFLLGIGQGRITDNLGTFINNLSGAFTVPDTKSIAMVYDLLDTEGLYLGASSALNVVAAVEVAQKLGRGTELFSSPGLTLN